jgi:hypothetical protein
MANGIETFYADSKLDLGLVNFLLSWAVRSGHDQIVKLFGIELSPIVCLTFCLFSV